MKKIVFVLVMQLFAYQVSLSQNSITYDVKRLANNQAYPDVGVAFFDEDFIIFSAQINNKIDTHSRSARRRKKEKIKLLPQNLDFYFSAIDGNGDYINSQRLSSRINSKFDDVGIVFTKDRSTVYFSREIVKKDSKEKHFELFKASVISPGSWVDIKKLPFNSPELSLFSPALSKDDKTLYFVSDKSGNLDIFKVSILSDWGFGTPEKLDANINTNYNETTPFVLENTLFFSSNKEDGLGGYDVYSINLDDKNAIAKRLPEPINSNFDDYYFIKNNQGKGYFSSNRPEGEGKEDVFFFKEVNNDLVAVNNFDTNKIKETTNKIKTSSSKNTKPLKEGRIVDIEHDKQEVTKNNNDVVKTSVKVRGDENIVVRDSSLYNYQRIERDKIFTNKGNIRKNDEFSKCQMEFDKINNIYFDYSESYIRADAARELDNVIRVLKLCPKIILLASSHTDSRASKAYNLKLSQERSDSVLKYILDNGHFSPERIIAKGFGEERLTNGCSDGVKCTERQHQANRRTHFEIYNY